MAKVVIAIKKIFSKINSNLSKYIKIFFRIIKNLINLRNNKKLIAVIIVIFIKTQGGPIPGLQPDVLY